MQKLTKQQFKEALLKSPLYCSEDELRFPMNVMSFTLKEFKKCNGKVEFEIHYQRTFIIKIEIVDTLLVLSNPWIIFNSEKNETFVSLAAPPTLIDLINLFITMCGPGLLEPINYTPGYYKGFSVCDNPEESKEYWDLIRLTSMDLDTARNQVKKTMMPTGKKVVS